MLVVSTDPHTSHQEQPTAKRHRRIPLAPYLYVLPAILLLAVWTYRPLLQTFRLSFYDWNLLPGEPMTFVGLQNYSKLMGNPDIGNAVTNTLFYIAGGLVFSLLIPLAVVMLSNRVNGRARTIYEALIFIPFLVIPVAASAVWRWLLAPDDGAISQAFAGLGLHLGDILRSTHLAIVAIIVIVGWQMLGFGVLVISAGFSNVDPDYAQAASVDGASGWRIMRRITLPLLSPTIVFLVLMTILLSAQWTYPVIDILTQGGPASSTTNIYYLLYQLGFQNFDAGMAGAAGTAFFMVFGVIAVALVTAADHLTFYDD